MAESRATEEFLRLLAGEDPNGLPVIEIHEKCPGHSRHWYTEYGAPTRRVPFCVRCGNPNPRWTASVEKQVIRERFGSMSAETVSLFSEDLLSKWGFWDGDILNEVLWDRALEEGVKPMGGDHHAVLVRAVREYLLPVLDQDVEVYEIVTSHNPIRASSVDGVEVDDVGDDDQKPAITPDRVDVPVDVLWEWFKETLAAGFEEERRHGSG